MSPDYEWVVQGFYDNEWRDLGVSNVRADMRVVRNRYRAIEGGWYRIIRRRIRVGERPTTERGGT